MFNRAIRGHRWLPKYLTGLSQSRAIFGIFAIIFPAKPCVSIAAL
jgi:hypothetical protein